MPFMARASGLPGRIAFRRAVVSSSSEAKSSASSIRSVSGASSLGCSNSSSPAMASDGCSTGSFSLSLIIFPFNKKKLRLNRWRRRCTGLRWSACDHYRAEAFFLPENDLLHLDKLQYGHEGYHDDHFPQVVAEQLFETHFRTIGKHGQHMFDPV